MNASQKLSGLLRPLATSALLALLFSACLEPVCSGFDCVSAGEDAGDPGGAEDLQCTPYPGAAVPVCRSMLAPVVCSGQRCADGEACCYANGLCFRPTLASLSGFSHCDGSPRRNGRCAADIECTSGFCDHSSDGGCLGLGTCRETTTCGLCFGSDCSVCGCNGFRYASPQEACVSAARLDVSGSLCVKMDGG